MSQVNSSFIHIFCRWDAVSLKETRISFNVKLAQVFWLFLSVGCGSLTLTSHLFLMDIVNFQTCSYGVISYLIIDEEDIKGPNRKEKKLYY